MAPLMPLFVGLPVVLSLVVVGCSCGGQASNSSASPDSSTDRSEDRARDSMRDRGADAGDEDPPDGGAEKDALGICSYTVTTCDGQTVRPPENDGGVLVPTAGGAACWCECINQVGRPTGPYPYCQTAGRGSVVGPPCAPCSSTDPCNDTPCAFH
jgi:hypothetical protein